MRWKLPGCAIQRGCRGQPHVAQCSTLCRHQKIAALHHRKEPNDSPSLLNSYDISIFEKNIHVTYIANYVLMTCEL